MHIARLPLAQKSVLSGAVKRANKGMSFACKLYASRESERISRDAALANTPTSHAAGWLRAVWYNKKTARRKHAAAEESLCARALRQKSKQGSPLWP